MSRPDDIPADVWEAACELWALLYTNRESDVEEIARAILAEREAGAARIEAVVADRVAAKHKRGNDYLLAAASVIRKGTFR